ncbi:unnamed protein product [Caenorhabditis nigoni]
MLVEQQDIAGDVDEGRPSDVESQHQDNSGRSCHHYTRITRDDDALISWTSPLDRRITGLSGDDVILQSVSELLIIRQTPGIAGDGYIATTGQSGAMVFLVLVLMDVHAVQILRRTPGLSGDDVVVGRLPGRLWCMDSL